MTKGVANVTGEEDPLRAGVVRYRKNNNLLAAARVERKESEPVVAGRLSAQPALLLAIPARVHRQVERQSRPDARILEKRRF
jgi:hypothetical protein